MPGQPPGGLSVVWGISLPLLLAFEILSAGKVWLQELRVSGSLDEKLQTCRGDITGPVLSHTNPAPPSWVDMEVLFHLP